MKDFRSCLGGLCKTTRPMLWKLCVSVLVGLCEVALSLLFVLISKRVVDIATGRLDGDLVRNVFIMASIMLAQVIIRVVARYWEGYLVIRTANSNRADYFRKAFNCVWDGRDRFHSGDTVNRLEEDIRVVTDFISVNLPEFIVTAVQLVAATILLFALSPSLAWYLVLIMPAAVVGSRLFFRKMRLLTGEIRAVDSSIQGHMQENLLQRVVVKTLGGTVSVMDKMGWLQTDLQKKTIKRLNYGAISRGFMQLGFASGYALAFFWGVFGLRDGSVSYGLMVAFLQLVGQVQRPVAEITRHIPAFIRALSSEERLMEIDEIQQEENVQDIVLPPVPGIRVTDLSYSYPGQPVPVFTHLDFDFKPGSMTAIIGSTGAGKSTLIRIILALLKPDSGSVVLYSPETESGVATRCNIMYVPQGNSLMSGTIRQNLLLAKSDATDEELKDALHLAAADFVFDLPKGLATPCSEVGRGLSEGQAQRIAIARALLRPGGILILDEATSALDADTEQDLLTRLSRHYKGSKTILCITHRPAATSFADAVLKV